MTVSEYIWKQLAKWGTNKVFVLPGGGAMFLDDALGREKDIDYICCLHEQGCAMAAEGYARISGKPGVVCVTTGPGGTNTLTGVLGAWVDSIPMFIISGQIKRSTMITSCANIKLRQLGDQEYNIVDTVKPMTKFAKTIMSLDDVQHCLKEAWIQCNSGRPGPVWLDIPLDIQSQECNFEIIENVQMPQLISPDEDCMKKAVNAISLSKRPVFIVGYGLRNSKCVNEFINVAEVLNIPTLTSISGIDIIESNHRLFYGRPGILGERAANLIMQNSDCLIVVGTRMGLRICGYAYDYIAREATKIMIDIDDAELNKPTFKPDIKIHSDAKVFLDKLIEMLPSKKPQNEWLNYCSNMKKKYPIITNEHRLRKDFVSSYVFPEKLYKFIDNNSILVTSNGTAYTSTFQAMPIKNGMRMFSNEGCASMGYGLPAAIGASIASPNSQIICLEGDGSIQMNIQELQTILTYNLPIKVFVYNNEGYLSMKNTYNTFFNGKFMAADANSGIKFPSLQKIAYAYGYEYYKIENNQQIDDILHFVFSSNNQMIVEVMLDPLEKLGPKATSKQMPDGSIISLPLEDMSPLLPRDEFLENMLIKPINASLN